MKTIKNTMKWVAAMVMSCMTMSVGALTVTDTIFNRYEHEEFAFGADVSFVPQMEGWGTKWLDKNGKQKDILQILKEQGINNIRLRVWTVSSGASSKQEVVNMCKRAKAMGMGVMIDFHYSDSWADPKNQTIPAAWTDHSVEALAQNVYDHTYDVLSAIKKAGVVPKWVQVGNETKRGMLYPVGNTNEGGAVAFAKFVQKGYDAVKAVDSSMQVIVHLPDGHDNSLYRKMFDLLKNNGANWDIIGMSAYPRWSHLDGPTMINKVMSNINDLKKRYGKPCMVVETGHYPKEAIIGNNYLVGVMDAMIKNGDLGCFYWEPESMGGYDMGAWDEATRKPTVMMDAFLGIKHTEVNYLMSAIVLNPKSESTVEDVTMKAYIKHVRNRIKTVDFCIDSEVKATLTESPWETEVGSLEPGVHFAWVKATDTDKQVKISDSLYFFAGQAALLEKGVVSDGDKKGGTQKWSVNIKEKGKYRMVTKFTSDKFKGADLKIGNDSIGRIYFQKKVEEYQTKDIELTGEGVMEMTITATMASGLPNIAWVRLFPLEGQETPEETDVTGIDVLETDDENTPVEVYSMSGVLIERTTQGALGVSLGNRSAAVMFLPYSVGGTPYIVRKQRLK